MLRNQLAASASICVYLGMAGLACDDSSPDSAPGGVNRSQGSGRASGGGDVNVEVIINQQPQVESMESSQGRVETDVQVTLRVRAEDPDGDPLTYLWTSTCPGSFAPADAKHTTFTPGPLGGLQACSIEVDVSDYHGGLGKGILVLTATQPKINVAPKMGVTSQSATVVAPGDVVVLYATATDPEGTALTWKWNTDHGSLSEQTDTAQSSTIRWTAPTAPGETVKVAATASDADGARASVVFVVSVRE